jgi:hypothetical protein
LSAVSSIASGDVVLCNLPPYNTQPWLSMGVVLHSALLAQAGLRARVVRAIDPPFTVPDVVARASNHTMVFDPSMDERLAAMTAVHAKEPRFFEGLVEALLSGGERVVGLCVFRNNVDVTLHVARLLKERAPDRRVVLGGPEAVEEPAALQLPWIDAVAGGDSESFIVPWVRALLEGRSVDSVQAAPLSALPIIDYRPLMPLFAGDSEPTVPTLLNLGCPHRCTFCSNSTLYSRFIEDRPERVLTELDGVFEAWNAMHGGPGRAPPLNVQLSDATTNALPAQLDALLEGVAERTARWGQKPMLRGQTLIDARLTDERLGLWKRAGFSSTFFGLDGASDRLRRQLKKPGTTEQVLDAVQRFQRSGLEGLTFGVPVGVPGETEEDFQDTERFVERVLALGGPIIVITVLPYLQFLSAQDPSLNQRNTGARRGVLWCSAEPGGDPGERARRYMRLVERIGERAPVASPIPPQLFLPAMLPGGDPRQLDAWMERFGREFDQLSPQAQRLTAERGGAWTVAERVVAGLGPFTGWSVEGVERVAAGSDPAALVVRFVNGADRPVVLRLELRDPKRPTFAQTSVLNITYQNEWRGERCGVDEALIRHCVQALERAGT